MAHGAPDYNTSVVGGGGVVNLNKGAVFPLGPSSDDLFWRTDILMLCAYDGARWLTVHEYAIDLVPLAGGGRGPLVAVTSIYQKMFTRSYYITSVVAPNNGAAYWQLFIETPNLVLTLSDHVHGVDTSVDAAATVTSHEAVAQWLNVIIYPWMNLYTAKIGAPGALTSRVTTYYKFVIP
jgi:hypothetical protein